MKSFKFSNPQIPPYKFFRKIFINLCIIENFMLSLQAKFLIINNSLKIPQK
jgi:hypothetical protein